MQLKKEICPRCGSSEMIPDIWCPFYQCNNCGSLARAEDRKNWNDITKPMRERYLATWNDICDELGRVPIDR